MHSGRSGAPVKPSKTCDVCKLRHQKCDSSRPCCQYCALRDLECVYSRTPAHQVTGLPVRRWGRNAQPSFAESIENEFPWLNRVKRSGSVLAAEGDLPQPWSKRGKASTPTIEETTRATNSPNPSPASPFKASVQHFVAVLERTLLDVNGAELAPSLAVSPGYSEETDTTRQSGVVGAPMLCPLNRNALPPQAHLQPLLDSFLDGPNKMVFVCEPQESQHQLDDLYRRSEDICDSSLSLILLQLAVGAQHLGIISHQICSTFYESGRRAMESGIEKIRTSWLWVVQAHVLDCIYSMNAKPNMSWVVLGSAIRISQTYRIDDCCPRNSFFSITEHSRWRQVWLGIVCLDSWLSAALGRLPQISKNTACDPFLQDVYVDAGLPTHLVQTNLARIGVIVGGILRDVYAANTADISTYETYVDELEKWLSALPPTLRFYLDHTGGGLKPEKSRSDAMAMYNLELVYLDTMLLVTRPLLLESTFNSRAPNPPLTQLNTRLYAQTCVDTANQISHFSSLLKSHKLLAKRSWPVIHANFHAALVLFTSLSQKESGARYNVTGAQLQSRRKVEYDRLAASMSTLAYCAKEDQLAKQYLSIAKLFHHALLTADVRFHPATHSDGFPIKPVSIPVDLSPQAYDYSSLPALTHASASQTSISTSTSYRDSDEVQCQIIPFSRMPDCFIDPTCPDLKTSNHSGGSINRDTWSATSFEPNVMVSGIQYAPLFAGYPASDDCGAHISSSEP